jgi:stage III sporulation protein SpoIIIAA
LFPGLGLAGKTTLLRDVARLMSLPESQGGLGMSVVIVDTSNDIAGEDASLGVDGVCKRCGRVRQLVWLVRLGARLHSRVLLT